MATWGEIIVCSQLSGSFPWTRTVATPSSGSLEVTKSNATFGCYSTYSGTGSDTTIVSHVAPINDGGNITAPNIEEYSFAGWYTLAEDIQIPTTSGLTINDATVRISTSRSITYAEVFSSAKMWEGWTFPSGVDGFYMIYAKYVRKYEYRFSTSFSFYGWARTSSAALQQSSSSGGSLSVDRDDGTVSITTGSTVPINTDYSRSTETYSNFYKVSISEAQATGGTQFTFYCKLSGTSSSCCVSWAEYDSNGEIILNGTSKLRNLGNVSASSGTYAKTFSVSSNCRAVQFVFVNRTANSSVAFTDIGLNTSTDYSYGVPNPLRKILVYDASRKIGALPTGVSRTGYTLHWRCSVNGTNVVVTSDTTMGSLGAGNKRITFGWTANTYSVTLNAQGGSGGTSSVTATYGQAMPSITVPARAHYAFGGYWTGTGGTGTKYYNANGSSARSWNLTAATTLYAMWTWIERIAVLDTRGGELPDGTNYFIRVEQGSAYGTLPTPTRTGYTFAGWYTAASGGTRVTASTTVTQTDNHILYAHWTQNAVTITVSFDAAGGTVSPVSKTATSGATYGTLPTATRAGYVFNGWWTEVTGGTQVTASTVAGSDDITLHAQWLVNGVSVTFNGNGGTPSESSKTYLQGMIYGALPTATRAGYAFAGWWTAATGGTRVLPSSTAAAGTLYAHWAERQSVTGLF